MLVMPCIGIITRVILFHKILTEENGDVLAETCSESCKSYVDTTSGNEFT